jgi:nitroreductase
MELTEVVRKRRMVRAYQPDRPVSRDQINSLLELAVRAPSAGFSQGWHFLVLDDEQSRESFWKATTDEDEPPDPWLDGLKTAPALIICFSDKDTYLDRYAEPDKGWTDRDEAHWPVPYWHIDTGMAAMLILLGAVDAGLAACFFGIPPDALPTVRDTFSVPDRLTPIGVVSLGYAAPDRRSPSLRRGRRAPAQVTSYGSFG